MVKPDTTPVLNQQELCKFGLVFASGIVLVFALLLPWLFGKPWPLWPWIVAAGLVCSAVVLPQILRPVHFVWMKIGSLLGWVNTRIILGLVFFVLFTPVAFFIRIFGKDPMRRQLDATASTYRIISEKLPRERMERPF